MRRTQGMEGGWVEEDWLSQPGQTLRVPVPTPQAPRGLGTAQDSSCPPKSSPCPGPAGTRNQNSVQSNSWHQTTPGLLATRWWLGALPCEVGTSLGALRHHQAGTEPGPRGSPAQGPSMSVPPQTVSTGGRAVSSAGRAWGGSGVNIWRTLRPVAEAAPPPGPPSPQRRFSGLVGEGELKD